MAKINILTQTEKGRGKIKPIAAFTPQPAAPPSKRGDTGKGPLKRDAYTNASRHTKPGGKRGM